jgi:hypothetical protein
MSMLTSAIVLVSALAVAQDQPGAAPAPAAQDPAGAPEAPAAPATTAPEVRAFLTEAEQHFYDPQADGLKLMEFDVPVVLPQYGELGVEHVQWTAGADPVFTFTRNADMQLPPEIPEEALAPMGAQLGSLLLDSMLNRQLAPLVKDTVATMDGVQDGLVKIALDSAAAAASGVKDLACYFDDDGVLMKSTQVVPGSAVGMPFGSVPITKTYSWKAARTDNEALVPDGSVETLDLGIAGDLVQKTTYMTRDVNGVVLVTGMSIVTEMPGGTGTMSQSAEARQLTVNGTAVPEAAPAPPEAPATPDAPVTDPPAGG